jgi:hypothetical protein
MICPYCGSQNADWAKACPVCGRQLPAAQQTPAYPQYQTQPNQPAYQQPPPPPPDFIPQPQANVIGPAPAQPMPIDTSVPPRKRMCPGCNQKIGMRYARTSCLSCGNLYHVKCFSQGGISVSSRTAVMLFPNVRGQIVASIRDYKAGQMRAVDDAQRNENRNKVLMIPEEDLISDTNITFCRLCVPKIRGMIPNAAKNLERAGRYDDAGKLFEEFGMIEEAGKARRQGKSQYVTNISVDLNQLLEKLKSGGLVSVYKCPNCGGSIKISGTTSTQKLSKCEYCGTVLQTDDLVNFIRDILS